MKIDRRKTSGVRSQDTEGKATANSQLPTARYGVLFSIRNPQSAIRNAFTLIELITVIVIIMLLTSILLPTIMKAKQLAYLATTKAYITQLESGALRYQQEKQCFPGQDITSVLISDSNGDYTASQVLGVCLFGLELTGNGEIDYCKDSGGNSLGAPTSEYVQYKKEQVVNDNTEVDDDFAFAPRDLFPGDAGIDPNKVNSFPLLYYPSRLGNNGNVNTAFDFDDNITYTPGSGMVTKFNTIIHDTRFNPTGTQAYNSDTFLLFGKAVNDRDKMESYFTENSPKNFK